MTNTRSYERAILKLEQPPLGALYRAAIGFVALPAFSQLVTTAASSWSLWAWFLSLLVALRIGPLAIRKLVPFSAEVKELWSARRRMAKRFDSFQWQKLLWFGVGMIAYAIAGGEMPTGGWALSAFCVVAGSLGLLVWRRHVQSQSLSLV
jgi:hypothetical protein